VFLAECINSRGLATVLRLSVTVIICRRLYGMYCG